MPHTGKLASSDAFAAALSTGLLWGIAAAIAFMTGLTGLLLLDAGDAAPSAWVLLDTAIWVAAAATILALFPIGPVAGVIGWQLYRRGIVARAAYVLVGAVAAFVAPVLILAVSAVLWRTWNGNFAVLAEGPALVLTAAFPILGAFAGYMAGGVLRRAQRS